MAPSLSLLSCFAGAGGLDLGLEAAGFESLGCLEIEETAREVLRLNRPHWTLLEPSNVVRAGVELAPEQLGLKPGELDLIAGGPPCQPFSKAAQWSTKANRGLEDPRGRAVLGMLDLVESFRPNCVLMENVPGFLRGPRSARNVIEERFDEINRRHRTNYKLTFFVVDSADYGVAQHRRRALALAFRTGIAPTGPPVPTHSQMPLRAGDALADVGVENPPTATGKWAPLLPCIPEGGNYQYLTALGAGPELFGHRTKYWSFLLKLARDRPSWTLPASPGPSTGPFHWDNRPLAAAERLALQGFPVDWKLSGSERDLVRLTGNATPPPLGEAVGRQIANLLVPTARVEVGISTLAKERRQALGRRRSPRPLPSSFEHLVGPKPRHPGIGAGPGRHKTAD